MLKNAPSFSLPDQYGSLHHLEDYRGKWLVLYFYPKDDTPGCTSEACSFRDERETIRNLGNAEIIGISKDSKKSHLRFADKYNINFPLLSNPDHDTIAAYGSWRTKKFMGREFLGTNRDTFIINPDGKIVKEYRGVVPKNHAAEIIADLQTLQSVWPIRTEQVNAVCSPSLAYSFI